MGSVATTEIETTSESFSEEEFDRKTYHKDYYQNNKERIQKDRKTPVKCDVCQCFVKKYNISAHRKSKKHQARLQERTYNNKILIDRVDELNQLINNLKSELEYKDVIMSELEQQKKIIDEISKSVKIKNEPVILDTFS